MEEKKYQKMAIVLDDKIILAPAVIRYFEVKLCGYNEVSIGLTINDHFDEYIDPLGFYDETVAITITSSSTFGDFVLKTHKGSELCFGNCVIGCGYDIRKEKVFFTKNGVKFWENDFIYTNGRYQSLRLNAFIKLNNFDRIEINTGSKPFMYDLEQEYVNENDDKSKNEDNK